jgi:hypothetical protein
MKLKTYSTQKFKEAMQKIFPEHGFDPESAHLQADALMCEVLEELGYEEGVKIFEHAAKWYA